MRAIILSIATAIMLATSALAVPSALVPRGGVLQKRTHPPVWYFPPYNGTFTPWKPIGCYSGDTGLTYNTGMCSCQNTAWKTGPMPFNMETCFAYCKSAGFRFAGIKGAAQAKSCWCGNGVTDDDKLSNNAKCNVPCEAAEGGKDYDPNMCGGSTTYTIYKDPCYKDYDVDKEITNYEYIGCFYYYDATILGYYIGVQSDNLSVDSCIEHCAGKGYAYAGMAASAYSASDVRGDQCWCGGKIATAWITRHRAYPQDNNQCTVLCSATKKVYQAISKEDYQYCGGAWYMSIYFNGNLAESETCEIGPPKSTITTTTPGPTPGTTTIPGTSTDTVVITVTEPHSTTTVSTPGSTEGTTTKTGPSTDTVIITTTAPHETVTVTTPGPTEGTTTKTGPLTDTVIITTPAEHDTTTVTTSGSTPGTTTKTGPSTDTVIITTTAEHFTITVTTPGPTEGTTTKTGPTTDTVIITTPAEHFTVTVTTPGPSEGTTTKTGPTTDTVIITTPAEHKTVTVTTPGPSEGTTTKTGPSTDTVIITTTSASPSVESESTHFTVTITTPGPTEGTTTKTGPTTDTVIITEPAEHDTTTITTPGSVPGTTTKTGPSTDTVIITTPTTQEEPTGKVTITETTPGPSPGTTTKTGPSTDTVIITTPTEGPTSSHVTVTETTPGPSPGTTTKTGPSTDTVIITTPTEGPTSSHVTVTESTPGPSPGTSTITGSKTDTVIITTTTPAGPIGTPPADSCCNMPKPSNNDQRKGIRYPLGGFKPSIVFTSDEKSYTLVKLSGIKSSCRTTYKYTIEEFQAACWNACVEQQKKCYASYMTQTVCTRSGARKVCFTKSDLKTQCDVQFTACKSANTNTKRMNNPLKKAMDACPKSQPEDPEDGGYYRM
ncbi:hypothetical protein AA313_de0205671 [Arthrobotrys entomopaga]|nr:hypothetical protein AA313_de0205671 [Arthrobotrys entomopaga]